jgi:hypothetical protein
LLANERWTPEPEGDREIMKTSGNCSGASDAVATLGNDSLALVRR